jgi:hypothetical protein
VTPIPPGASPAPPPVERYEMPPEARAVVTAELRARFPEVTAWYGMTTRRWWALVPGTDRRRRGRLIEANTPAELVAAIARVWK